MPAELNRTEMICGASVLVLQRGRLTEPTKSLLGVNLA